MFIPVEVTAKNFQSFETLNYKFNVGKSNLIQGENLSDAGQISNGSGKSTLAEIVYYCCIGSSSTGKRDIKLIRRGENESNISFTLYNSIDKSTLRIERDLFLKKSSQLRIFINKISQSDKFATIDDGNKFLLRLLGISAEDLKNFYLINRERFKPFFKLSDTDSRELISRFSKLSFNERLTQIIDKEIKDNQKILDDLKEDRNGINLNIVECQSKIDALKEQINNIVENNSPEKIEEAKKKAISLLDEQIEEIALKKQSIISLNVSLVDKITIQKELKIDCENNRNLILRTVNRLRKIDYTDKIQPIRQQISKIETDIKNITIEKKQINVSITDFEKEKSGIDVILSGKITCPKCSHQFLSNENITISEAEGLKKEIDVEIDNLSKLIDIKEKKIVSLENEREILEKSTKKYVEKVTKQSNLIRLYENKLQSLSLFVYDNEISRLTQETNKNKSQISSFEDEEKTKRSEIESIKNSKNDNTLVLDNLNKSIQLNSNSLTEYEDILKEIDSSIDKQVKVIENKQTWSSYFKQFYIYLTNQCLKSIQDLCNKFLEQIDTNLRVQIEGFKYLSDGSVKESINTVILRDDIEEDDYRSFSGGEKGKLTLATILAFQELINNNCPNGGMDLLFIDEILDAVDSEGMKSFINALNSITKTIYLTTHISIKDREENVVLIRKINDKSYIV